MRGRSAMIPYLEHFVTCSPTSSHSVTLPDHRFDCGHASWTLVRRQRHGDAGCPYANRPCTGNCSIDLWNLTLLNSNLSPISASLQNGSVRVASGMAPAPDQIVCCCRFQALTYWLLGLCAEDSDCTVQVGRDGDKRQHLGWLHDARTDLLPE